MGHATNISPGTRSPHRSRSGWVTTLIFALLILIPCGIAFGTKFKELVELAGGSADGLFAMTPVMNYLLASLGFLCLFVFAIAQGMFRDVEEPKRRMLIQEEQLDEEE
jgi:hypothetical protein